MAEVCERHTFWSCKPLICFSFMHFQVKTYQSRKSRGFGFICYVNFNSQLYRAITPVFKKFEIITCQTFTFICMLKFQCFVASLICDVYSSLNAERDLTTNQLNSSFRTFHHLPLSQTSTNIFLNFGEVVDVYVPRWNKGGTKGIGASCLWSSEQASTFCASWKLSTTSREKFWQ